MKKSNIMRILSAALVFVMVFGLFTFFAPEGIVLTASALSYDGSGKTSFGDGEKIRIINHTRADKGKGKSDAIYAFDGMTWKAADEDNYIVWEGTDENIFYGVYPATAKYNEFNIPALQNSEELLSAADWMTDDYRAKKSESEGVQLTFAHRLAKVTVNITKWNSEFDGSDRIIDDLKIYSKGTALTATYGDSGATITATDGETGITPLVSGTSYTAIVAPAKYEATDKFMTFTVNGQEMTVLANAALTDGLEAGNHYTFDLTVGKDAVEITEVTVNGWKEETINAGTAEECIPPIVNLNGNTANIIMPEKTLAVYVTEAVEKAISDGATAIVVSGAVDDECYAAVIEERSEAMVFFKDLEENNYIASNGTTYTCVIGSESAEKYVLISTTPRMDWISNNGNIEVIANQLLPDMVPGSRVIHSTEEAWSVYKPMVETCLDAETYPWPCGNDRQCYCYYTSWYLTTIHGGLIRTWGWFPVFDVPLS